MAKVQGQKLLIGSTGELPIDVIEEYAKESAVLIAPNFASGMRMLYQILETLRQSEVSKFETKIEDTHHIHKKDSPSGTALRMETLLRNNGIDAVIHSERSGEELGVHAFILKNEYEQLSISHKVLSRDVYAQGCLELISELILLEKGLHMR